MAAETAAAEVGTRGSGLVIRGSRNPNAAGKGPLTMVIAGKEVIGAMMQTIVEAPACVVIFDIAYLGAMDSNVAREMLNRKAIFVSALFGDDCSFILSVLPSKISVQ